MPQPISLPLDSVRTDGWFDRVGQTVSSFQALCDILGERFFAFSLIAGTRITALTVDRRNPENTLVDFTVGGAEVDESSAERLTLAEFQRRLVSALLADSEQAPRPRNASDAEGIQRFIGSQYLLLAPLYDVHVEELMLSGDEAQLRFRCEGVAQEAPLDIFREALRERVRAELDNVARTEERSAIDLGYVPQAEELFAQGDFVAVKNLLATWPAALTIFLRTPEAQALQAETRAALAHALGLLGSSCSALGESAQAEEILRLAVQYAGDGDAAAGIYERLGEALCADNRMGEAIGPLRRAASLGATSVWPRLGEAFLERGRFLAALGAVAEARNSGCASAQLDAIQETATKRLGPAAEVWHDLVSN